MTLLPTAELGGFEQQLVRAFDDAAIVPVALLVAAVVGAAHGLAPGHGKTIAAAYLVGSQASRRHAVALAGIVATMHTTSVVALGMLWWATVDRGAVPIEATTRWAQLAVAIVVLAIGATLIRRRWRERHSTHHHHHHRPHAAPWSRAGLVGIASVGGLLPSPSAFLVLISGLLTGRVGLALSMVVAFGVGLAATVLAVGVLTVSGRDWLRRRPGHPRRWWLLKHLPLVGAAGVLLGGSLLCVSAVGALLAGA